MRLLDPNSTVREGEFATAASAGSVTQKIWNMYNKLLSGERLTVDQRADFSSQANNVYQVHQDAINKTISQYTDLANQSNIDPKYIITSDLFNQLKNINQPQIIQQTPQQPQVIENNEAENNVMNLINKYSTAQESELNYTPVNPYTSIKFNSLDEAFNALNSK